MKIGWNKMNDREKFKHLQDELQRRGVLTIEEWEHYNMLHKACDPKGYEEERTAAHKRIAMRNAKNDLTVVELQQIIEEKIKETIEASLAGDL